MLGRRSRIERQEARARRRTPRPAGSENARDRAQERVRHLDEDAGAVAGVDLGAGRAAMVEAAERAERGIDDVAALRPRYVDDEADAAGIMLEARVVEAARGWEGAERQRARGGLRLLLLLGPKRSFVQHVSIRRVRRFRPTVRRNLYLTDLRFWNLRRSGERRRVPASAGVRFPDTMHAPAGSVGA